MVTFNAFRLAVFFSNKISEVERLGVNVASKISRPTLNRLDKKIEIWQVHANISGGRKFAALI